MIRYILSEALFVGAGLFSLVVIAWELYRHRDEILAAFDETRGDGRP